MKMKLALVVSFAVTAALGLQFGLSNAYAASHKKIDCSQVTTELQGGKTVAEVAKDMKISKSSVYRCRKAAAKEAKAAGGTASPAAIASPAAMASPAAAPATH